ncbi:MAG: TonB-dependent receptor [Terracidiphilus sp.]|nr:TonB-dependent receptor [Terracidiphilus sp.]MDR3797574.1 TonB-dependent receptor [Terracidiphilus sp.]
MKGRIYFVFILCFAIFPLGLRAQAAAGFRVTGVVHDATGGVIAGAVVTLRQSNPSNPAAPLTQQTDGQGSFQFVISAAGTYAIDVRAANFAIYHGPAAVSADAPNATLDVTLAVNGSAETVEVTADSLAAETTSTQLGETLESKKLEAVPLNGRSFTDLMAVQPGIVPVNTAQPGAVIMTGVASTPPSGDANPGNLSISGQREDSNGFRVNGADVEEDVNMGTSIVPNLDAIDSFRVLTSNFDAEYGNSSGGQVLVTTKAGADQWHGSAFEFLRNTALDARNYFSSDRAAYRQNQYGGTVGGPLFRTGVKWFADYQGTRLTEGIDTGDISVPSLAERGGDFTQVPLTGSVNGNAWAAKLSSALGQTVTPGEPYAQVFPAGQIPQSIWSAPAKYLMASIPQPNAGAAVFETTTAAETLGDNKGGLRADWSHGRGALTGYYFRDNYSLDNPYPTGTGGANVPGFNATSNGSAQLVSLEHTMTFGAAMLNEAHLGYMRNANSVGQPRGGVGPTLAAQGFTNIVPLKPSTEGVENLAFNDFTIGVDTTALVQTENIYEGMDAFSRIVGKHGLKFGGELHKDQINTHPDVVFNGSFSFNGSETGVDFADFLLGVASSYTQGQAENFCNRNLYMAAFAQDSWKATDRLTVNYGVRWDRIRPWLEKYNQLQTLVEGEQSQVFPGAPQGLVFPGDPGVPDSLAPPRNDFSPRAGIAYSPSFTDGGPLGRIFGPAGTTSIRLGYGMYYTAYEGLSAGIMSANPPYGYTYTSAAPPLFASPFTVAATGANARQRFPLQHVADGASRANPNSTVDWSQFEPLVGIPAVSSNDVTPYAQHWMASVERQLGASTLVTVSYVGTSSHHLLVLEEANPADPALCLSLGSACGPFNEQAARTTFGPAFGSVELQRTIANSSYNAFEATLNHRSHGLDLLASYTYAKSLDQSAGLPEPVNPIAPSLSRGLSAFDLRHNFVTSFRYEFPKLKSADHLLQQIEQGWAVAGIARFTTGLPVTLLNNNDTSLLGTIPNGINNNGVDTPQWSGNSLSIDTNPRNGAAVFDASQFSLPALGTMGNARRRFFSGPGMENLDATISREFSLREGRSFEFRAEGFNVCNHAQFFGPATVEGNISSGTFGQAVSAMPPRLMQVAMRVRF